MSVYDRARAGAAGRGQLTGPGDAPDRPRADLHRARRRRRTGRRRGQPLHRLGLLLGPADPRPRRPGGGLGGDRGGQARHLLRRRDGDRGAAGRRGRRPLPLGGDGADDQLRHRGGDERGAPGAGDHRPRGRGQVRRRLPRPLRRAARRGRLGDGDAVGARQPRRAAGDGGADRGGAVERPRRGRGGARRARGRGAPGRAGRGEHGRRPGRRRLPRVPPRGDPRRRARC